MTLLVLHPVQFVLCGILASILINASSGLVNAITFFSLLTLTTLHALFVRHFDRSVLLLVVTAAFGTTSIRYHSLLHRFETAEKRLSTGPLSFTARVASIESTKSTGHKYHIILDSVALDTEPTSAFPTLVVYVWQKPQYNAGDIIRVKDLSIQPVKKESMRYYFIKQNLGGTAFASHINYTLLHRKNNVHYSDLSLFKEIMAKSVCLKMNRLTSYFFKTVFLGKKTADKQHHALQKQFAHLGICHLLARSGLHVTSITSLWLMILRTVPILLSVKQVILTLLLCMFYVITWGSIPFARALLGVLMLLGCTLYRRPVHHAHLMLLNTSIMLIYNPYYLFALDFQLSYSLAITIAIYNHLKKIKPKTIPFLNQ